jgi:hypothetical protein
VDKQEPPYEVGYGRPPRASRFAKGKSGNPNGRPKGSKNLSTVVLRESRQRVRINGPSGARTLSKLEAAVRQVSNKAAQGDLRASRDLFSLVQHSEAESSSGISPEAMHEIDQRVLESLHKRIQGLHSEQPTQPSADPKEESK